MMRHPQDVHKVRHPGFAFTVSQAYTYQLWAKGRFPQELHPGKPFLKQQQHNNVVEATRHSKQQRVYKITPGKSFEYFCHSWAFTIKTNCISKNDPTLKRYSSKLYGSILTTFGRNIQKTLEQSLHVNAQCNKLLTHVPSATVELTV